MFGTAKDRWDNLSNQCKNCQAEQRANRKQIDLNTSIRFVCQNCSTEFFKPKRVVNGIKSGSIHHPKFCSHKCYRETQRVDTQCKHCKKTINRTIHQSKFRLYCSQECYHLGKTRSKVSKLEIFLQASLIKLYPGLDFVFNGRDAINSELDIYIPSLKLAFELNGIFHYEPIFGDKVLNQVTNNDKRKFQACLERGIELCIIDSSKQRTVNDKTCLPYLDIIKNIINSKLT